jgi:hypothetical protein
LRPVVSAFSASGRTIGGFRKRAFLAVVLSPEAVLEHLFVGDLLRVLWKAGPLRAEVMKAQVDDTGYDLFTEANGVARQIQLKGSFQGARTATQKADRKARRQAQWLRCLDPL